MGATGDAEQPRGPGGAERGGPELGDSGAAGQLVLTVRLSPGRLSRAWARAGWASGSRDRSPRARERGGWRYPGGWRFSQCGALDSNSGAALLARRRRPGCQLPLSSSFLFYKTEMISIRLIRLFGGWDINARKVPSISDVTEWALGKH